MKLSDREYLERLFGAFYEVGALPGGGVTRLGYTALEDEMHRRFGALAEALCPLRWRPSAARRAATSAAAPWAVGWSPGS